MPARLIYIDNEGRAWLVRDGVVQHGKFIAITLGDHYAPFRVFDLKEPRIRKVYRFPKGIQHAVNGATLDTQFLEAKTVTRGKRKP